MARAVQSSKDVLEHWVERDLTAAARRGQLAPAFGIAAVLEEVRDAIGAGRNPVVTGEAGVGKSAIIEQLAMEAAYGEGVARLAGKRILQISIRARLSSLPSREKIKPEMQKLVMALIEDSDDVVPFFRDLHEAYTCDLEPQLESLALRFPNIIIGESNGATFDAMLETSPALEHHYFKVSITEPGLDRMETLLQGWSKQQFERGVEIAPDALLTALHLTHRFLGRARQPRKALDLLGQVIDVTSPRERVSSNHVIERFVRNYRVPEFLANPSATFDPTDTERRFRARLLEQPEAIDAVVRMITLIKSGMSDARRPFAAFLFVGPTGVGKTHVAQLLAEYLFGSRERLVRINLSDHQQADAVSTLFGNPDAYSLIQRRGLLTSRLVGHPFAVLLLDEFEKSHRTVHDRFLQLFDEGTFVNGEDETVSCRSLIIIATSNAGAELYRTPALGFAGRTNLSEIDRDVDKLLAHEFRHEFLNRFDQIVHFHPLSRRGIRAIALREVELLAERIGMRARALKLRTDESVLDWLASHGYHPHFGARFLRRTIERHVTTAVAEVVVQNPPPPGTVVDLTVRKGRIVARADVDLPREERQSISLPVGPNVQERELDRATLVKEAEALVRRAETLFRRLDEQKARSTQLLEQMGQADFWTQRVEAQLSLDEYRRLDVELQLGARLASPIRTLVAILGSSERVSTRDIARAVEAAATAVSSWLDRAEDDGANAVWLLLRNVDPMHAADRWIEQLSSVQRAWTRRLHLQSELVAFGLNENVVSSALLEIEGPGAETYLSMEVGIHRLHRGDRPDWRVRIDLVPCGHAGAEQQRVQPLRRPLEFLELQASWVGSLQGEATGAELRLYGHERRTLERALADVQSRALTNIPDLKVARDYGRDGTGARDPRTGATVARFKDVQRGRLDALLEAWRRAGID